MGLRKKHSSDTLGPSVDPDPRRFHVMASEVINGWTIAVVMYPDCNTFEGKKLLVFPFEVQQRVLANRTMLDPHFGPLGGFSPVARFEPTDRGYRLARLVCQNHEDE